QNLSDRALHLTAHGLAQHGRERGRRWRCILVFEAALRNVVRSRRKPDGPAWHAGVILLAPSGAIALRRLGLALHLRHPKLESFEIAENLLPLERLPNAKFDLFREAPITGRSGLFQIGLELIARAKGQVVSFALGCGLRLAATAALWARL